MRENIAKSDRASLWQHAEMLRGITQELERATTRLSNRLRYGSDSIPSADAEPTRPSREGVHGSLEDTYDDIANVRDRLLSLVQDVGERGEGPRGELKTDRPNAPGVEWATPAPTSPPRRSYER